MDPETPPAAPALGHVTIYFRPLEYGGWNALHVLAAPEVIAQMASDFTTEEGGVYQVQIEDGEARTLALNWADVLYLC